MALGVLTFILNCLQFKCILTLKGSYAPAPWQAKNDCKHLLVIKQKPLHQVNREKHIAPLETYMFQVKLPENQTACSETVHTWYKLSTSMRMQDTIPVFHNMLTCCMLILHLLLMFSKTDTQKYSF